MSRSIFLTENASDKVTAKGRPYGIATTTTVSANIKYYKSAFVSMALSHVFDTVNF